jgi:exonuclease III
MRVVSWNMGNNSVRSSLHDAAWHHLLDADALGADIALIQEAVPPPWIAGTHGLLWTQAWPTRAWGTGIAVKGKHELSGIDRPIEGGRFVAGRLKAQRGPIVLVSVHARTDVPEFIPPLRRTFKAIRDECADSRFIVGGDLNTARRAEEFWPGYGHAARLSGPPPPQPGASRRLPSRGAA